MQKPQQEKLRRELKQKKICLLTLMSSPGSGKTTTLLALDEYFRTRINWGVMEADIDSDVDANSFLTGSNICSGWRVQQYL